jgi:hypothetical protein
MRLPISVLSCVFLILTIASCNKDKPHQPGSSNTDSVVHINYIYLATNFQVQQDSVSQYELILSSGSTVLLDTIAPVNIHLITDIKTPGPLVDMTVIIYRPIASAYYITTNKAISPGAWSVLPGSDSLIGLPSNNPIPNYTTAYVYYTNVPVPQGEPWYFSGSNANFQKGQFNNSNNELVLGFLQTPDFDVYLSFPNKGRYNFHRMSGALADSVNLANMDTAVSLRIAHPAMYTNSEIFVNGFPDSTNLQQNLSVSVYAAGIDTIAGADVVYPGRKVFQKYEFSYTANDNGYADEASYADFWADSVNPTPFLPDNTYFNLLSATSSNFSVQFTKLAPGYYTTQYTSPSFYLTLNAPGDSTKLQPVNILTALNSKMLKNVTLSTMTLTNFGFNYQVIKGQPVPVVLEPGNNQYEDQPHTVPTATYTKRF